MPGVAHMDPKYWDDPDTFRPERFIDPNGKIINSKEGYQPFGIGEILHSSALS